MKTVEELDVFKLSHSLALEIFELTKSFPDGEKFGLVSQMRRAAYSIPMNLMEGGHRRIEKSIGNSLVLLRGLRVK